jgi:exosortase/archaeosortase family protein
MRILPKVAGILAGSLVLYLANLVRITGLYYTLKYRPGLFDLAHVYIGQTFIICVGILFFLTWITKFASADG